MMKYIENCKFPVLKNGSIYCTYGYQDPDYGGNHWGMDIIAKKGNVLDYVCAMDKGTVIYVKSNVNKNYNYSTSNDYGNNIKIQHENGTVTRYCHLKYGSITVKAGDTVKKGQVLAYIGNTGYSFGAHLHFEVIENNISKVNPIPYLLGEKTVNREIITKTCERRFKALGKPKIRAEASVNGKVLGSVTKGEIYDVCQMLYYNSIDNLKWLKLSDGGYCMYIDSDNKTKLFTEVYTLYNRITSCKCNFRKSMSTDSDIICIIPKGKDIKVALKTELTINGYTWYVVKYDGKYGYLAKECITKSS